MDLPSVPIGQVWGIGRTVFTAGAYAHPGTGWLQLRLVRRGSSYADIDLGSGVRRVFTRPGDLLLSLPHRPTSFRIDDRRELTVLQIEADEAHRLIILAGGRGLEDLVALTIKPVRDALVAELCRWLETGLAQPYDVRLWTLGILLARLLARASSINATAPKAVLSSRGLAAIVAMIDARLDDGVSIDELAARAGQPRRVFARAFREATGLPTHQFILRRRADTAASLLATTDLSIADVAARTGFSHQAHLSRVLKSLKGRTPGQIRAGARAKPTES